MSTKNSIGTGLQRPVEISFSLMTMSNSCIANVERFERYVTRSSTTTIFQKPRCRSILYKHRFERDPFIPFNFYLLCKILFFYSNYNVSPFNEFVSRFLHLPKKRKKKGKEKGAEGKRIIVSKRRKKRRSLLVKRPSLSQRRPLSAPTEAGSGGLRLASRFLISASKQGASDFPSIERGCLWDGLTTSRHCISRTVRGRLDEFGRTAVQSA